MALKYQCDRCKKITDAPLYVLLVTNGTEQLFHRELCETCCGWLTKFLRGEEVLETIPKAD